MWFKNLQLYRLPTPWNIDLAKFEELLGRGPFVKCPSNQPMSRGWVSPRRDGTLVFSLGRQWMIALSVEQRLLPSSVVNEEVKERAEAMEAQQGYAPGRKQLVGLKTKDPKSVLEEGAQIVLDPKQAIPMKMVGHVTSSYWSENCGRSIAMGLVEAGFEKIGQTIFVPMPDRVIEAEICDAVFYDKEGGRINV